MTSRALDLHDIQGNIVKGYGRFDFPKARYILFAIDDAAAGRAFLSALAPSITSAAAFSAWQARRAQPTAQRGLQALPEVTTNIALSYAGLRALAVPRATLQSFPEELAMGMRARAQLLGDEGTSAPTHWDPVWCDSEQPHVLISLAGREDSELERRYEQLEALVQQTPGVWQLHGHRAGESRDDLPYQSASAIFRQAATTTEHFGYVDAMSNPYFHGSQAYAASEVGGGKRAHASHDSTAGWAPLETGEFLLGYRDEASELAHAPTPKQLAWNSTFMVFRKLHQNVGSFDSYLEHVGREFPGGKEALAAKLAGRWRNGAPLGRFRTQREAELFAEQWSRAKAAIVHARNPLERSDAKRRFAELDQLYSAFDYTGDLAGGGCPLGAHTRRANPRGALSADDGTFQNRRRLLRRSLPYGDSQSSRTDYGDHGLIFIAFNASLSRQFEHVQRAWLHSGNHSGLADEQDPLTGAGGSFVVQTAPDDPRPPFFCSKLPRFVETRGGDYFFVPSLTALRAIAEGNLDPT